MVLGQDPREGFSRLIVIDAVKHHVNVVNYPVSHLYHHFKLICGAKRSSHLLLLHMPVTSEGHAG